MSDTSPPSSLGRYASLARLLLRHGRSDLVSTSGLGELDATSVAVDGPESAKAAQLADDLEAMGPTFVKLGQLLSTRHDLLPPAYTSALARLQDSVAPMPFEEVSRVVEEEFGMPLRHLVDEIDETPLAAASLGQVHRARLRSGREVVLKVQRPEARSIIEADLEVLTKLADVADKRTDAGRTYGFGPLLQEFRKALVGELDYRREARNLTRFRELLAPYPLLLVPEVVPDLVRGRVLCMEWVDGKRVTDVGPLGLMDIDASDIVSQLFAAYLNTMLNEGFLHADPHPGNLLLTADGRLALLDLGMVASLSPRLRDRVVRLLVAIGDGDGEEASVVLAGMGTPLEDYDAKGFREEVTHLVNEAVVRGSDIQAGTVLVELSRLSGAHGLRPPAEMSMVGKALLNLDRATLHLDPTFEPADAIRANLGDILASGLMPSPGGLVATALEAKEFTALLPKRANRILDALAEGDLQVRVDAFDERRFVAVLQKLGTRITLGLIIASTVLGAALALRVPSTRTFWGYPALAMGLFLVSVLAAALLGIWILLTDRRDRDRSRPAP